MEESGEEWGRRGQSKTARPRLGRPQGDISTGFDLYQSSVEEKIDWSSSS